MVAGAALIGATNKCLQSLMTQAFCAWETGQLADTLAFSTQALEALERVRPRQGATLEEVREGLRKSDLYPIPIPDEEPSGDSQVLSALKVRGGNVAKHLCFSWFLYTQ